MTSSARRAVAYYRVSTQKQGEYGLGLEAQKASVTTYAKVYALKLVASYTEIETGSRKKHWPELEAALVLAHREGAVLLIAKLGRLSRNVHFLSGLLESGVDFTALDMPNVDHITLQMFTVMAGKEAALIARRTREALAARKAQGLALGNTANLTDQARAAGRQAQQDAAVKAMQQATDFAQVLRTRGQSLSKVAGALNASGFTTRQGAQWTPQQVKRILDRIPS